jgi:NADPH-dependent F420 reductase
VETGATTVAIIGGTGDLGAGLARRLARGGFKVVIGSRDPGQAQTAAEALVALAADRGWGDVTVAGAGNPEAAAQADLVFVTVPFSAHAATLDTIKAGVQGKVVVDVTVPLVPPKVARVQLPEGGSAGQIAQNILGEEVRVVSAMQNVAAAHLNSDHPIDCDVLVTGNNRDARQCVIDVLATMDVRGFHAGMINNAAAAEALTSVLINLNKQYKTHAGIRLTGIE